MLMFRYFGVLGICAFLLIAACSPEHNLARNYVKNHTGNAVMILPLNELFKDNLAISYDTNIQYSPEQFDSIAWAQSCYIKQVSDSEFLTRFTNSLIDRLTSSGFDVYVDGSSDIFLSLPDPKWMVQIAQLQLNEDHKTYYHEVYATDSDDTEYEGYRINQVSLETWFEVSRTNTGNKQVLYLEGYIEDEFKMGIDLDLMGGTLGYTANRDSVKIENVYDMAHDLGDKHADLLFDYFMNDYIRENLPSGITHREYYHYDRRKNALKRGLQERFDVVN
jgi:hypothetical protein